LYPFKTVEKSSLADGFKDDLMMILDSGLLFWVILYMVPTKTRQPRYCRAP